MTVGTLLLALDIGINPPKNRLFNCKAVAVAGPNPAATGSSGMCSILVCSTLLTSELKFALPPCLCTAQVPHGAGLRSPVTSAWAPNLPLPLHEPLPNCTLDELHRTLASGRVGETLHVLHAARSTFEN